MSRLDRCHTTYQRHVCNDLLDNVALALRIPFSSEISQKISKFIDFSLFRFSKVRIRHRSSALRRSWRRATGHLWHLDVRRIVRREMNRLGRMNTSGNTRLTRHDDYKLSLDKRFRVYHKQDDSDSKTPPLLKIRSRTKRQCENPNEARRGTVCTYDGTNRILRDDGRQTHGQDNQVRTGLSWSVLPLS